MSRRQKMRWEIVISICIFEIYLSLASHIGSGPSRPMRDVDIRCRLTPHYTWKCDCWEKNVYLMLEDHSDYAFVCNSDYELQVVQNGARSGGHDERPHHREDYGRDEHGRPYGSNIDHPKADDFRQKSYNDDFERKWRDYKDTMPSGAAEHRDLQAEDIYNELNGIFPDKFRDKSRFRTTTYRPREKFGDDNEKNYNTNDRANRHNNLMSLLKPSYDDRQQNQQNTGDLDKGYKNNAQYTTTYNMPENNGEKNKASYMPENNGQQNELSESNDEQSETTTSNDEQHKTENTLTSGKEEKQPNGDILLQGSVYNPKSDFYKIAYYKDDEETNKPTTATTTTTTTEQTTTTTTTKAPTTTSTTTTKQPTASAAMTEIVVDDAKCKWQGKFYSQGEEINLFGLPMNMSNCKYLCREHGHIKKECHDVPTFYGKKDAYFPKG